MLDPLGREDSQTPRQYGSEVRRQVIELARAGTKVKQFARTFQMSDGTIYKWLKQAGPDRPRRGRGCNDVAAARARRGPPADPAVGDGACGR